MEAHVIRQKFLDFFASKEHVILPSSSLVPENDPTALFIVAGMQPLVPYLMGKPHPEGGMLADSQKCIRTNDIDEVGDNRHCTFFEMLGNWSLGTYFKKEAIYWAFEFLTEHLELDSDRLLATVFEGNDVVPIDNESIGYWKEVGLTSDRIYPSPAEENWWPDYGAQGPCGPDTEIYYDLKPGKPHTNPAYDDERYIEIWNLVFMEYYCDGQGTFTKLEKKNVDTGSGFERLAMVLQEKETVYETDIYATYFDVLEQITGLTYQPRKKSWSDLSAEEQEQARRMRIIVDHTRASVQLIADGVSPTNEGRGYVLRRLIRRAVFSLVLLSEENQVDLSTLVEAVIAYYAQAYPHLQERKDIVVQTISEEVEKFMKTLRKGKKRLEDRLADVKRVHGSMLSGQDAFELYDTYGFPLSLTEEIASIHNVSVDVDGYAEAMAAQQERSREGSKGMFTRGAENVQTMLEGLPVTEFAGYKEEAGRPLMRLHECNVLKVITVNEGQAAVVLDQTVFYAESGGQVGDRGVLMADGVHFIVEDTQKYDDVYVHFGRFEEGDATSFEGLKVTAAVDEERRMRIMASHTGAHLLHKALIKYLGEGVEQAGSYVDEYRTRFDFSFGRALTSDELRNIEQEVNEAIARWEPVQKTEMSLTDAQQAGAMGLFTEKYGETVRVCDIGGGYSKELCGGTHVSNTSQIGVAMIVKDSSIASGVRRIEMITGMNVYEYLKEQNEVIAASRDLLKAGTLSEVPEKIDQLKQTIKDLEKLNKSLQAEQAGNQMDNLVERVTEHAGVTYLQAEVMAPDMEVLKQLAYGLRDKQVAQVALLYNDEGQFVVYSEVDKPNAKDVLSIAQQAGAKGGGSPKFAQGVNLDTKVMSTLSIIS